MHEVYLTATVLEPRDVVVEIGAASVMISCSSSSAPDGPKTFQLSVMLFAPIDADLSQFIVLTRGIRVKLKKVVPPGATRPEFWPRLTSEKVKLAHLTVDWDTWKDEDDLIEEDDDASQGSAFSELMGFRMSNGTTISGAGDPNAIADMQRRLLEEKAAAT